MEDFNPFPVEADGVGIHDGGGPGFKGEAKGTVKLLTDDGFLRGGGGYNLMWSWLVHSFPFVRRNNGDDIVIPMDEFLIVVVVEFGESHQGQVFQAPGGDLLRERIASGRYLCRGF